MHPLHDEEAEASKKALELTYSTGGSSKDEGKQSSLDATVTAAVSDGADPFIGGNSGGVDT